MEEINQFLHTQNFKKEHIMLRVERLSLSFGERKVLDDISFTVSRGEKVGLTGANGAGKTTILRVLIGEISPESGFVRIKKGVKVSYVPQHLSLDQSESNLDVLALMLNARNLHSISIRMKEIEKRIEKNPSESRMDEIIQEYFSLQEEYSRIGGYQAESDVARILSGVGLGNIDLEQRVKLLSGGQKTKLAFARALFEQPDLLLLDEPTNHVEMESVDWLAEYVSKSQQSVVVISHLQDFLDAIVSKILFLDKETGKLKTYPGNYSQFLSIQEMESMARDRLDGKVSKEIARQRRLIHNLSQSKSNLKHSREKVIQRLESTKPRAARRVKDLKLNFSVKDKLRSSAISVEAVGKSFQKKEVFRNVSFRIGSQERIGIVGENGSGKTTLLRMISQKIKPDKGRIFLNPKATIGWYHQEQEDIDDSLPLLEEVKKSSDLAPRNLYNTLAHFLFPYDRLSQSVGSLSRGERARLILCKIMLTRANILVLDEPTNHLDKTSIESLIQALSGYNGAMIAVSHDREFLRRIGIYQCIRMPSGTSVNIE